MSGFDSYRRAEKFGHDHDVATAPETHDETSIGPIDTTDEMREMGAIKKMNRVMRADDPHMKLWWDDDGVYWLCDRAGCMAGHLGTAPRLYLLQIDVTGLNLTEATNVYWNHVEERH